MPETNFVAIVKEKESYVFFYDDESAPELFRTLGRFAGNPELSFSWYEAAVLSKQVRHLSEEGREKRDDRT